MQIPKGFLFRELRGSRDEQALEFERKANGHKSTEKYVIARVVTSRKKSDSLKIDYIAANPVRKQYKVPLFRSDQKSGYSSYE